MAGIKVTTNIAPLMRKVSSQAFTRGKLALASQIGADSNRFVPRKSNHLRESQVIASDGSFVQWGAAYANRQYHAPLGWHYSTPGTGPHWDEVAKGRYMKSWTKAFVKGCGL